MGMKDCYSLWCEVGGRLHDVCIGAPPRFNFDRPRSRPLEIDIKATGNGFSSTEVQFTAVSEAGKAAMAKVGGFACIGMSIRKSHVGQMLDVLSDQGVSIEWVA